MKKLIFTSLVVVLLVAGLYRILTPSRLDFEDGVLAFGASFTFFGLLLNFTSRFSSRYQNTLRWLKGRLILEKKMTGMSPKQKILEEIKLLEKGQFHGGYLTGRFIDRYRSMPLEKAEKIGTKPELVKLERYIRFNEKIFPFYCNVLLVSGILLILIDQIVLNRQ